MGLGTGAAGQVVEGKGRGMIDGRKRENSTKELNQKKPETPGRNGIVERFIKGLK